MAGSTRIFLVLGNVSRSRRSGKRVIAGVFEMVGAWMVELLKSVFFVQIEGEWRT